MTWPTWINWTNFLAVWVTLYALALSTQHLAKEGSGYWKFCHAVLALSPGDFIKLQKTIGTQLVPPTAALLLLVLCSLQTACSAAPTPAALPPPNEQAELAILGSEIELCRQTSPQGPAGRPQYDACRAGVERYWCGDGGALSLTTACPDGGAR